MLSLQARGYLDMVLGSPRNQAPGCLPVMDAIRSAIINRSEVTGRKGKRPFLLVAYFAPGLVYSQLCPSQSIYG